MTMKFQNVTDTTDDWYILMPNIDTGIMKKNQRMIKWVLII